jgi:hypothetical protein
MSIWCESLFVCASLIAQARNIVWCKFFSFLLVKAFFLFLVNACSVCVYRIVRRNVRFVPMPAHICAVAYVHMCACFYM